MRRAIGAGGVAEVDSPAVDGKGVIEEECAVQDVGATAVTAGTRECEDAGAGLHEGAGAGDGPGESGGGVVSSGGECAAAEQDIARAREGTDGIGEVVEVGAGAGGDGDHRGRRNGVGGADQQGAGGDGGGAGVVVRCGELDGAAAGLGDAAGAGDDPVEVDLTAGCGVEGDVVV